MSKELVITTETRGHRTVLALAGEVDLASAPDLETALDRAEAERPSEVLIDLSRLEFIDLAGMRVLERAAGRCADRGGRMILGSAVPRIARIMELAGSRLEWAAAPTA